MTLINYRPNPANALVREFFNEDFFSPVFPALEVSEDDKQFSLKADLPGLKKEDIHLTFDNGVLTLEGERKAEQETKEKNYHRFERAYGRFTRRLNLGPDVDAQAIKADYKDGVLSVNVPKSERAKPKNIDINIG